MNVFLNIIIFILSIFAILWGTDKFLDMIEEVASYFKISAIALAFLVIGIDLEESVASWIAASNQLPEVALGNIIGNSIISITLCFALPAFFFILKFDKIKKEYFFFLITFSIIVVLSFLFISFLWLFGIFSISIFIGYIYWIIHNWKKEQKLSEFNTSKEKNISLPANKDKEEKEEKREIVISIALGLIGFIFIYVGSDFLVNSIKSLITQTTLSEAFFGIVIVAAATNIEEYSMIFKSIKRKREEIGIGGVIGKIIWNLSINFGISALIIQNQNILSNSLLINVLLLVLILIPSIIYIGLKCKQMYWREALFYMIGFVSYLLISIFF